MPFSNNGTKGSPLTVNQYFDDSNPGGIPIPTESAMITELESLIMLTESGDIMITEQ